MTAFLHHLTLGAPLFALILIGYLLMRFAGWPRTMAQHLTTFVFSVGLPAMLFRMMSDLSQLPPVDGRLLVAFFGGCLLVFLLGRLIAGKAFGLDGIGQSVFGIGCIFSNNIMLGLPLAKASLGDPAIPSVALVLLFNALILWTLVSLSVEWHRHGSLSLKGLRDTVQGVLRNPIILAILAGSAFGLSGAALPAMLDSPLKMLGQTGMPLALVALGMSLAEYNLKSEWKVSLAIVIPKLLILPLIVFGLARLLALPPLETRVIVLLASIGQGANVFLMARQFKAVEGGMAGALILSTALSAITTPLALAMAGS
ncbi:AEC family transporter [Dechloromonas agitata]|uniref:AEC family transporter n=1 Tax=Dechloromonas agitata TaxID=73030 RepID=UPI00237E5459|nr:AEC family transporter [Dechloromonas agitata]MDE1546771.1 AEC family transporter [Dechloromonas agitata]